MFVNKEYKDNFILLTFNTGTKYNVFNVKFMTELLDTLSEIEKEKKYRFIVFKGENGNFGSGADIRELNRASIDREFASSFFNYMKDLYLKLINIDKITIAQVEGIAYGASLELLLVMDFVIASKSAKFAAPGGKIGVFPPVLLTLGPYIIGLNNVKRLAMLGEEITAEEAEKIGLITKATDEIDKETANLIYKMSFMAPSSLMLMKRHIMKYLDRDLSEVFKSLTIQVGGDESREGINAFLAKTKPSWLVNLSKLQ
jgi:enoyl-CoA hydratase/carnithine racemase